MLVPSLLDSARRHGGKLAVKDPLRQLTYNQLVTLARVLRRIALAQTTRDKVGLMLPATGVGLGALFGTLWAGKQAVPLNFLLQPRELQGIIADAGLDLVLGTKHFEPLLSQLNVRTVYIEDLPLKRQFVLEKLRGAPEPPDVRPDEIAIILYTSGTTGQPKGVCLTHDNLLSNSRAAIDRLRLSPDDHFLGVVPPFHVFGLTVLHLLPMVLGATVTYIPRFSPQAMYRAVSDGITILLAVPSMFGTMARLKEVEKEHFASVRLAASGGEPLPRAIYELVKARTGLQLVEGYGMTETSPIISVDLPWAHRVGTVGPPLPGVEVQLRSDTPDIGGDMGGGRPARHWGGGPPARPGGRDARPPTDAALAEGELYVRGPLVMKGYYNRPAETSATIDTDGWLRTGDIARIDAAGYIAITGRAKDLIIVAGENVYPREVENVLEEHPAVAEAAVVGRQDGTRGEVVVAFVALKEGQETTSDELRSFCRDRLAGFKTPRDVHIRPALPRGPTGKVLKRQLVSE